MWGQLGLRVNVRGHHGVDPGQGQLAVPSAGCHYEDHRMWQHCGFQSWKLSVTSISIAVEATLPIHNGKVIFLQGKGPAFSGLTATVMERDPQGL